MAHTPGALAGLRVLDLTRVLAGPLSTMFLADMGAEIIKIEQPGIGDDSRAFGPRLGDESAYFMHVNRNKIGITLNLKGKGRDLFLRMVRDADIVLENYRPGTMEKLGLGYEQLKAENPRIIFGRISGFGQDGPYAHRPGYDILAQAMGGLMGVTGWPNGEPTRSGVAMGDVLGGLSITIGLLAALHSREQTGQGQEIDVALLDTVVACLEAMPQFQLVEGRQPGLAGNRYEPAYPYDSFQTADGRVVIGVGNDKLYSILCQVLERPDLLTDPRFLTNSDRVRHHVELRPEVEAWTRQRTSRDIIDQLLKAGVPVGPINSIKDLLDDPQLAARNMFQPLAHPTAGPMTLTGPHIRFSNTPSSLRTPAPTLGQDNEVTYQRLLGLSPDEVRQLTAEGVL